MLVHVWFFNQSMAAASFKSSPKSNSKSIWYCIIMTVPINSATLTLNRACSFKVNLVTALSGSLRDFQLAFKFCVTRRTESIKLVDVCVRRVKIRIAIRTVIDESRNAFHTSPLGSLTTTGTCKSTPAFRHTDSRISKPLNHRFEPVFTVL